ncbi:MAG: DUF3179 domain-containing (seleno)protein [Actinomycetota bacterium]
MSLRRYLVVALALALLASACGGSDEGSDAAAQDDEAGTGQVDGESAAGTDDATGETGADAVAAANDEAEAAEQAADLEALLATAPDPAEIDDRIADFLDAPNSNDGAELALAMGVSGDTRWGPWLVDIYRLGRSTRIDNAASAALFNLSGLVPIGQRTDDYRVFGNWVYREGADPGDGYRRWKTELYGSIDEEFATLLDEVPDDVLLSQIQWGGVARGGIPELNDPVRLSADAADFMTPDELVLAVAIDGEAVAYPVRILAHHELANDVIAGIPVSMVYCTLCRSALMFDRRVDDGTDAGERLLDFQTSGLLIESNKIMVDVQTDTLWRHQTGVGMSGPLEGFELAQYPVLTTTWAEWLEVHPDTEVLDLPAPIFPDAATSPEQPPIAYSYDPDDAYRFYYEDPDVWFPIFDTPDAFDLKEPMIGLLDGDEALAVQVSALVDEGTGRVFAVGDRAVALVPGRAGARAYEVGGAGLETGPLSGTAEATDDELTLDDGSTWPRVAVPQLFWFAWFGQQPDTAFWPEG